MYRYAHREMLINVFKFFMFETVASSSIQVGALAFKNKLLKHHSKIMCPEGSFVFWKLDHFFLVFPPFY